MSDGARDVCGLSEMIETEPVVDMLEESLFLDLTASMETRGEIPPDPSPPAETERDGTARRQMAGQRRRKKDEQQVPEEPGVLGFSLPTAIVPPSSHQAIATSHPQPPKAPLSTSSQHHTQDPKTVSLQISSDSATPPLLPSVNIQLTAEELQALFGILQQRSSTHNPHPLTTLTSTTTCSLGTHLQPIAPKSVVAAVVVPSPTQPMSMSSRAVIEAQAVVAAKASVKGKKRHCNCRNSQCLKLYCDCFSHEESCSAECSCRNCHNNPAFSKMRELTLKMYKGRDPKAFQHSETHTPRGCRCRKTLCLKKYCDCFHSGVPCSLLCRCINCKNTHTPPSSSSSSPSHPQVSCHSVMVQTSTQHCIDGCPTDTAARVTACSSPES